MVVRRVLEPWLSTCGSVKFHNFPTVIGRSQIHIDKTEKNALLRNRVVYGGQFSRSDVCIAKTVR